MTKMKILIDNGHGSNTAGKRSPDSRLLEWRYTREIAQRVVDALCELGYDAERIVTEDYDVTLKERCRRVNRFCGKLGTKNVILVSIHCNAAASDGKWHTAKGWGVYVSRNASQRSKALADNLFDSAKIHELKTRQPLLSQKYWVQNLAICRDTNCAAVLTENLFQDNIDDVNLLLSEGGKGLITELHVEAIVNFINTP